jgi:hypothetical protein
MKKLLTLIAVIACLNVSAQTMVYDTTVVRTPLVAAPKGVTGYDTLYMPAATTSVNGYMTAQSVNDIGTLQTGLATANNNIVNLQATTTALATILTPRTVTTTTYTAVAGDNERFIIITNTAAVTFSLPTGLTAGWTCKVMQQGGRITFSGVTGAGVTVKSPLNYYRSQTVNAVVTVTYLGNNVFSITGNLAA